MTNWFFNALSETARSELEPHIQLVTLRKGEMLYTESDPIQWVYLPNSGLIGVIITMESGKTAHTSVVGRNGLLSTCVILDVSAAFDQAVVEVPGDAMRIPASRFVSAYRRNEELRVMVNRYHAMTCAEAQQSAACNALHQIDQRICRWLLEARDRTGLDALPITQESLGQILGVRRASVSAAQSKLVTMGLISVQRGMIEILDVEGLQGRSCECYRVLKERTARIFPGMRMP